MTGNNVFIIITTLSNGTKRCNIKRELDRATALKNLKLGPGEEINTIVDLTIDWLVENLGIQRLQIVEKREQTTYEQLAELLRDNGYVVTKIINETEKAEMHEILGI
jgi:hypothetical protein